MFSQKPRPRIEAERIAVADRHVVETRTATQRDGEILLGEGNAASTRIYAKSPPAIPAFLCLLSFYGSLLDSVEPRHDNDILSLSSPIFQLFPWQHELAAW